MQIPNREMVHWRALVEVEAEEQEHSASQERRVARRARKR